MQFALIILCGGRSTRLGQDKARLPFGPTTMLERVVEQLRPLLSPIVVVAAAGQELPSLASDLIVVRDRRPDAGPLEGLAAGLRALQRWNDEQRSGALQSPNALQSPGDLPSAAIPQSPIVAAYITGCDFPLLLPEFVTAVCSRLGEHQASVPVVAGIRQTLASVVRIEVLSTVEQMLLDDQRTTHALFDRVDTRWIEEAELRNFDPQLVSLRNVNTRDDYQAALIEAGFGPID